MSWFWPTVPRSRCPCTSRWTSTSAWSTIAGGRQLVLPVRESCQVQYDVGGAPARYQLDTNSVYFFTLDEKGWLDLRRVDLGGDLPAPTHRQPLRIGRLANWQNCPSRSWWTTTIRRHTTSGKLVCASGSTTFRKISAAALSREVEYCRRRDLEFRHEPIGFKQALSDFRKQVDPHPGRLAIGFTGRYQQEAGRVDLGATQGMLQSHILIREWAAFDERAGAYRGLAARDRSLFGCGTQPRLGQRDAPVLADDKAIHQSFHIEFDPANTLIINLVADEIRSHQADSVADLSPAARQRLTQIYEALLKATPDDKSIRQYLSQLNMASGSPLAQATRLVVREVRQCAQTQRPSETGIHAAVGRSIDGAVCAAGSDGGHDGCRATWHLRRSSWGWGSPWTTPTRCCAIRSRPNSAVRWRRRPSGWRATARWEGRRCAAAAIWRSISSSPPT